MNVLSLFDGISCGQVALERAGVKVDRYYASEIDKYAIQIALKNYPDTIQLGDVREWKKWDIEWSKIDLLIGGSPCTDLSIAGKRKGLSGEKSRLFYDYVDILNYIRKFNPSLKFLLENVESMPVSDRNIIDRCLGVNPIMINSSLVSAQNRKRYYWFNWGLKTTRLFGLPTCSIPQPEDKHILLKDILETSSASIDKNIASCASDCKEMEYNSIDKPTIQHHQSHLSVREYGLTEEADIVPTDNPIKQAVCLKSERTEEGKRLRKDYESGKIHHGFNEHRILAPREDNKTNTLTTAEKDNLICEPLEYFACRGVGRKLDEEGRRKDYSDAETVQIIEINLDPNKVNALTTVTKDNLVCELLPHNEPITEGNIIINNNDIKKSGEVVKSNECVSDGMKINEQQSKRIKIGDKYYDFYTGDRKKKTELDYIGGVTTKRNKWIDNGKNNSRNFSQGYRIYSVKNKAVSLNANSGGIGGKTGLYQINLPDGEYIIRKLTPVECERLQTLPDNYTKYGNDGNRITMIPRSARYKALGNGWTVDVVSHIFKFLTKE